MNDIRPADDRSTEQGAALDTLFRFHELWLAERMPDDGRSAVYWQGKQIPYDELKQGLEDKRKFFVSPSPYPGLRSFTPQESRVFFGRPSDVEAVRDRLKAHRMVMVLGGSGSGKSSLVRAGVLPHLNGVGRIGGRGGTWYWCEFRPEQTPLANLITALAAHVVGPLLEAIAARREQFPDLAPDCAAQLAQLGLEPDLGDEAVRDWVAAPFLGAQDDDELFDALWTFVQKSLNRLDDLATGGIKAGNANLLILLDQFEEIFREARDDTQTRETKQLLGLLARMDERLREPPWSQGGLFIALTMRSEELHRCGEHSGLTDIVNRSVFLLELLDPQRSEDRKVLHRAIVEPARRVFISYGLSIDTNDKDCPFAPGVPDWLIDAAGREWTGEHRPDQLPLLQHALRSMWDRAIDRWKNDGAVGDAPRVKGGDLPGDDPDTAYPDLDRCLSARADAAAEEARGRFMDPLSLDAPVRLTAEDCPEGEVALRATFSALSRQDDRGNRARRFATLDEIVPFLENDEAVRGMRDLGFRLERALSPLIFHGYLTGGRGGPYDISHEALIRNWDHCTRWLRQNEEVVRALRRFLDDIDPDEFDDLKDQEKIAESVPGAFRSQIALIGENLPVPTSWALDQLDLLLRASAERRRTWLGQKRADGTPTDAEVQATLARIQAIARTAREARVAIREENARKDERAKQTRQHFLIAAVCSVVFLFGALLSLYGFAQSNISYETASRVLATSQTETPAAAAWSHAVKLGVFEKTVPQPGFAIFGRAPSQARVEDDHWDALARSLIGSNFWLTSADARPSQGQCWTQTNGTWMATPPLSNGRLNVTASGPRQFEVANEAGRLVLRPLAIGGATGGPSIDLLGGAQLPPLGDQPQVCLSNDASVVTVALRSSPVPNIYELNLLNCQVACDAYLRQISPSLAPPPGGNPDPDALKIPRFSAAEGSATVQSIDTSPRSEGDIYVAFHVDGSRGAASADYVATFRRGWVAAQRIPKPAIAKDCYAIDPQNPGDLSWTCPRGASGKVTVSLKPQLGKGAPGSGALLREMTAEIVRRPWDRAVLSKVSVWVPPDARPITIQGGNLMLIDGAADYWSAQVNEDVLTSIVVRDGDGGNLPGRVTKVAPMLKATRHPPPSQGTSQ